MLQDIRQDDFMVRLSQATRSLGFPVLVHTNGSGVTASVNKGVITPATLPSNLLAYVNNAQEYCSYFSHGDSVVVIYFLRFRISSTDYTVMVQDNKKSSRLNKFVAALMDALHEPIKLPGEDYKSAEQEGIISFMDMRIKELEKTVRDRGDALAEKTKELVSLNSDIQNLQNLLEQQEQDAVLDATMLEQEKQELALKLSALEEQLQQRDKQAQAKAQELPEYEVKELWNTAAHEEVSDLQAVIDKAAAEREELLAELERSRRETASLQEKLDARNADINIHKEITESKDEEIRSLKLDLRNAQSKQAVANSSDIELAQQLVATKEQAAKLEIENEMLQLRLSQIEEDSLTQEESNEQLQQIEQLERDKQALADKLTTTDASIAELKQTIIDINNTTITKAEHETLISSLRASHELLQAEHASTKAVLEEKERTSVDREEYNQALEEVERWKKVRARMQKEQDDLRNEINDIHAEKAKLNDAYKAMYDELENRGTELANKEALIAEIRQDMREQLKQQTELRRQMDSLVDMNGLLRKNRDKLNELINGLSQPLMTVGDEMKIVTANRALAVLAGSDKSLDLVGDTCHKRIYGGGKPCSWCKVEAVKSSGEPMLVSVVLGDPEHGRHLDVTFFPIFDADHTLVEVGEFIIDKTEVVDLNNTINKFKEKMNEFKKSRVNDMNELAEVKRVYQELGLEHEKVAERNSKMLKVIERLASEDKARELLNVRKDLMETRNKLYRSVEMVKNYQRKLDEQVLKYSNLHKNTFMQMERLLNIMKTKVNLRAEETASILSFLTREFESVKKYFAAKARKEGNQLTDGSELGELAAELNTNVEKSKEFQSEEERILYERLHATAQKVAKQEKKK